MRFYQKISLFAVLFFCAAAASAQSEISRDGEGQKVIKGFLTPELLAADTSFNWYAANQKGYTPYPAAVQALKTQRDSVQFLVFAGTWCHDTQFILPRFFALTAAAGLPANAVTTVGVDAAKRSQHNLTRLFAVENVPTIIVLKNGRETGRVVEYGKTGMFEKDLSTILQSR